jgi:hypothetical protein
MMHQELGFTQVAKLRYNISVYLLPMIYYFLSISNVVDNFLLQLLNQIVSDLSPEHPIISTFRPLREFLGHSPFQVALFMVLRCVETLNILHSLNFLPSPRKEDWSDQLTIVGS